MKKEDQARKANYRNKPAAESAKIPEGFTAVSEYGQGEQFDFKRFNREAISLLGVGPNYKPMPGQLHRTSDGRILLLADHSQTSATQLYALTFDAAAEWLAPALEGGHYTPENWLRLHGLKPEAEQGRGSLTTWKSVFQNVCRVEESIYQVHGLLDLITMRFIDYVNDHGPSPEMGKAISGYLHLEHSVRDNLAREFEALCAAIKS